jgi:predicted NUDIX family NTP pyrophosphohydrolase
MAGKQAAKKRLSAGILMYRLINNIPQMLLAHPGGPFFAKKDEGSWSIPKGEPDEGEELLNTALREFKEETGLTPEGDFTELGSIVQKGGKEVFGWGVKGDLPANYNYSANMVELQWPPKSGKIIKFPEIDKVEFFNIEEAKKKIKEAQIPLIERLLEKLGI